MTPLRILSAGAAQAVTERVIEAFRRDTGAEVVANFGAVGAMKSRVTQGEGVDLIILTQAMIDELARDGYVQQGSRFDLGRVGTGIAVRAGCAKPDVSSAEALRAALLAASRIVCPDPAIATAGKIVVAALEKLGIAGEVRERLGFFPNGYAAMKWLAASSGEGEIGITQVTEILPNEGVSWVGPLPDAYQMKTVYSAGIAAQAQNASLARDFVARFGGDAGRALLTAGGYEVAG